MQANSKDQRDALVKGSKPSGTRNLFVSRLGKDAPSSARCAKLSGKGSIWVHLPFGTYPDKPSKNGSASCKLLPPFQIISHSKNLGESNFSKFDQIYIIK